MSSPLAFTDLFNVTHEEPSVTGLIEAQVQERARGNPVNDLILLSPFRSGKPLFIRRFRQASALASFHDPDRSGDQGVALARIAKGQFADPAIFGAADILTCRVDPATQSQRTLVDGGTDLLTVKTADYGSHTRRARVKIESGTHVGKKITLKDDNPVRDVIGDDLGVLLSAEYTGDASTAALTIRRQTAIITYNAQPADATTVTVNGVIFEFDSNATVGGGNVAVAIGGDQDTTLATFRTAVLANVAGCTVTHDTAANTVTITNLQDGVVVTESTAATTVAHSGDPTSLVVALAGDQTDGSVNLLIPLSSPSFKSLALLAAYINAQLGYEASIVQYANKFLPSSSLDVVAAVDIATAAVNLTGYVAAIADFINTGSRGIYEATIVARGEPDNTVDGSGNPTFLYLTGGTSPAATVTDWENALIEVGTEVERGGIILVNTDDPAIMAMVVAFIDEQKTTAGKWFRAYFGAEPAQTTTEYLQLAASINSTRARLVCQRVGVFAPGGGIEFLHPIFLAAALAGGAAGNLPHVNPLTNKQLRFAAIHENDSFDLLTRASLLAGGITVIKSEENVIRVALHVTTSQDPDRRMVRIASEIDVIDGIDSDIRLSLLPFRGKWANGTIGARVLVVLTSVLRRWQREGALSAGKDEFGTVHEAWSLPEPAYVLEAGVLKLLFAIRIGGELNHISEHGIADYARLVGSLGDRGVDQLTTVVPIQ